MTEEKSIVTAVSAAVIRELEHLDATLDSSPTRRNIEGIAPRAAKEVARITAQVRADRLETLTSPFVAFLDVNRNGERRRIFFSRGAIPDHRPSGRDVEFASYLAPLGRAVAQPVGKEVQIPSPSGAQRLVVNARAEFRSVKRKVWDAVSATVSAIRSPALAVPSMRQHLDQPPATSGLARTSTPEPIVTNAKPVSNAPAKPLEPANPASDVYTIAEQEEHRRLEAQALAVARSREIVAAVELRDQPILDAVQDPIFRLPISSQFILTGAPGTGKTTTLIKRLSQKTKPEYLSGDESMGASDEQLDHLLDANRSWVLFTPSDLLRNYLREALAREGLPATEATVRTWTDERLYLARDVFQLLRVNNRGYYRRSTARILRDLSTSELREYLNAFVDFADERLDADLAGVWSAADRSIEWNEHLSSAVSRLHQVNARELAQRLEVAGARMQRLGKYVRDLRARMADAGGVDQSSIDAYVELRSVIGDLAELTLGTIVRSDPATLRSFGTGTVDKAKARLQELVKLSGAGNDFESTEAERAQLHVVLTGAFGPALRLSMEWVDTIARLGLLFENADSTLASLAETYSAFRHSLSGSDASRRWFQESALSLLSSREIDDVELDLLLFLMLRRVNALLDRRPQLLWRNSRNRMLERAKERFRTVVTVDEAPDFSALQLGCMYLLAHPTFRSFAMSGDLMQRINPLGLRDWTECSLFADNLEVFRLDNVYRQSRTLLAVAADLYRDTMQAEAPFTSPFPSQSEPRPLYEDMAHNSSQWIADRILEVYGSCGRLPSIAVLVPNEEAVQPTARELELALFDHAIAVDACPEGRVLSVGERVRVFSVEYIKGLEFHAAFLVSVDELCARDAAAASRYMYLALTRAMMFVGVTTKRRFPREFAAIRHHFVAGTWADHSVS